MQIKTRIQTEKPESNFDRSLEQELQRFTLALSQVINKGLKFTDNFNAEILDVADSGVADAEFTVAHTLKRVPAGFIVINIDKGGVVYSSGTAWTETDIYLKCSAANCAISILVF